MPFRQNWASPDKTAVVASPPLMVWNSASRPSSAKVAQGLGQVGGGPVIAADLFREDNLLQVSFVLGSALRGGGFLLRGGLTGAAAAGQQAKGQRQGQQQSK